jgi:hypothetical protein
MALLRIVASSLAAAVLGVIGCSTGKSAPTCAIVEPSAYDRSCANDSDCVAVFEQQGCCPGAALSRTANAQYSADVAKASAGCPETGCAVSCGIQAGPCCRNGVCELGPSVCPLPGPAVDAGAEASVDASDAASCATIDEACARDAGSDYRCIRDWQTAEKASTWCSAGAPGALGASVGVYTSCDGFDIVAVGYADTSTIYYYGASTQALVGIEGRGNGGSRCIGGVSPDVPLTDCFDGAPPASVCQSDAASE